MLSAHILGGTGDGHFFTALNKARWVKLVWGFGTATDYPADTKILGRVVFNHEFEPEKQYDKSPEEYATWLFNEQLRNEIINNPRIQYWETGNEHAYSSVEGARAESRYTLQMAKLIVALGKRPVILNQSVGTPDLPVEDRMKLWRELIPALKYTRDNKGYIGLHEYSNLKWPWNSWLQYRYKNILPWLDQIGLSDLRILITEFGFDNLPDGGKPWRELFNNDIDVCAKELAEIVKNYQTDFPRVEALFLFTFGGNDGWPLHNIDGVNFPQIWRNVKPPEPAMNSAPLPPLPATAPLEDLSALSNLVLGSKFDFMANGLPMNLFVIKDGQFVFSKTLKSPRHLVNVVETKETARGTWWRVSEQYWIRARKLTV